MYCDSIFFFLRVIWEILSLSLSLWHIDRYTREHTRKLYIYRTPHPSPFFPHSPTPHYSIVFFSSLPLSSVLCPSSSGRWRCTAQHLQIKKHIGTTVHLALPCCTCPINTGHNTVSWLAICVWIITQPEKKKRIKSIQNHESRCWIMRHLSRIFSNFERVAITDRHGSALLNLLILKSIRQDNPW